MEIFGYPGEKLIGFSPNVPNQEFFQHATLLLSILAVNLDLPVAVLMLDPSNTNFSGWRGAIDQARQRFQVIQRDHIARLHRPVYLWKVRQWLAEDAALRRAAERLNIFGHRWNPEAWPYIEPVKDAMGDVIEDRNLRNSARRLAARRGIDYEDLVTEIVEDRSRMIRRAHEEAERLNGELGLNLAWKDIIHWPMPEGVSVQVGGDDPTPQTEPSQ
jgi:capsid protein